MSRTRDVFLCLVATCIIAIGVPPIVVASENADVCSSEYCADSASVIQKNMDQTIDPCKDFYKFSCGGFLQSMAIPDGDRTVDVDDMLLMGFSEEIQRMLDGPTEPETPKHFKLVKTLYASCMNPASTGDGAVRAYGNFLKEFGGWPVVDGDKWDGTNFNWRSSVHKFRQDGNAMSPLVNVRLESFYHDAKGIIELNQYSGFIQPGTAPKDFDKPYIQNYYNIMVKLAVQLGADKELAASEIRELIIFEMKVANITLSSDELMESDATVTMSIAELNQKYPTVKWMEYIKNFVGSSIAVSEDDIVQVQLPEYYVNLEALMSETPKRIQANFVISRIALRNAIYSSEKMRLDLYDHLKAISGLKLDLSREKFCTSQVLANLWLSFISAYVSKYYDDNVMRNVVEMTNDIEQQWNETLTSMDFMDETMKEEVMAEANAATREHTHYPPEMLDEAKLEEFYANLKFTGNFFANMKTMAIFDHNLWMKDLRHVHDAFDWRLFFGGSSVNPITFITSNYIPIPVALLSGIYAASDLPKYVSYAAIGKSIGYDIGHSHDWLMMQEFKERVSCIVEQRKEYYSANDTIEDSNSLEDDIADIMSTKMAYLAYTKRASRKNANDMKLPGLEKYSSKQMFWIIVGANQCVKYSDEVLKEHGAKNNHTPAEFHVTGPISNIEEFANDFACPDDSPMRVRKNCFRW